MFLNGETLDNLKSTLVKPAPGQNKEINVDCASIVLTVGKEVYVTPSNEKAPKIKQILNSDKADQFEIPVGQFALIITNETVTVPNDLIAFISFKAKYKFKGLINVSGFHVDPGWQGQLTFSVFNAGPSNIVLQMGDAFALIWYAKLGNDYSLPDSSSDQTKIINKYCKNYTEPKLGLSSDKIIDMTGDVYSPFKLKSEVDELKKEIASLESKIIIRYATTILAAFVATITFIFREDIKNFLVKLLEALGAK